MDFRSIWRDITECKQSEERAKAQQQQLIQADRLSSLGLLVAGVAHEINNPNQAILANATLITEAWKSITPILQEYYEENGDFVMGGINYSEMREHMPKYLQGTSESGQRIDSLVNDLKGFSRQEAYDLSREVDVNDVVRSAVTLSKNMIKKATKSFHVSRAKNLPRVKGNSQGLQQVMINLIQNACQALRGREEAIYITASYNQDKQCVEISVQDEGLGIPEGDLLKVKDPFFTTRREVGGTGLGLSISSTIIEDHGGTLELISEFGKGTTAIVSIPLKAGS